MMSWTSHPEKGCGRGEGSRPGRGVAAERETALRSGGGRAEIWLQLYNKSGGLRATVWPPHGVAHTERDSSAGTAAAGPQSTPR